jgi:hypothetical protein
MKLFVIIFKAPFFKGIVLVLKLLIVLPVLKEVCPFSFTRLTLWLSYFAILRALMFPSWQVLVNHLLNSGKPISSYPRIYFIFMGLLTLISMRYPVVGLMLVVEWLYLHTVKTKFKLLEKDQGHRIFLQYNWEIIEAISELLAFGIVIFLRNPAFFVAIWFLFRICSSLYFWQILQFKSGEMLRPKVLLDSTIEGFSLKMIIEIPLYFLISNGQDISVQSSYSMLRYILNGITTGINMITGPLVTFFYSIGPLRLKKFGFTIIWFGSLTTVFLCFLDAHYYLSTAYSIAFVFGAISKRLSYAFSSMSGLIFGLPLSIMFYFEVREIQLVIAFLTVVNLQVTKRIFFNVD